MATTPWDIINEDIVGSKRTDFTREFSQSAEKDSVANPVFTRMIVLDVITDPNRELKDPKRQFYWSSWGVINLSSVRNIVPRNSIIAKKINSDDPPIIVFPFFPSHLSLPCKPGECVWAIFEKAGGREAPEIAFWFCRVTDSQFSDDVNHSHPGAFMESTQNPTTTSLADAASKGVEIESTVFHELRNSPAMKVGEDRLSAGRNLILKGQPEDIFEFLITSTEASKLICYEAVPRFRKRPADIVLEGSNNALIVIGTDRTGPASEIRTVDPQESDFKSNTVRIPSNTYQKDAGSIDIVAGRGYTEETRGKIADTTSIVDASSSSSRKGTKLKSEVNKSIAALLPREGDLDYKSDRSRVLVAQKTSVDANFNLTSYNKSNLSITDSPEGDAAIVIKSDKVRVIARSDMQFIVTNFVKDTNSDEQSYKKDEEDPSKWASITIKKSGDIVFTPSSAGLIKLGGDDANLGLVCTLAPAAAAGGSVVAGFMNDSMGGPVAGTLSKKVLVK